MKRFHQAVAAGAFALATVSASPAAAVTLLIKYDPITDPRGAFSFNVDSEPVPTLFTSTAFGTTITNATGQYLGVTNLNFFDLSQLGLFGNYYGSQIFSGPTSAPSIFRSGSYAATFLGNTSEAGTVTISAVGAVPEPATWAMMLLGFGVVGFALRRRRRQTTTVRFQMA